MVVFSAISAGILLAFALIQAVFAIAFARTLRRYRLPSRKTDADLPRVSILLSLRGADPFLARGLRRLMRQDYPQFDLRIVTDHADDPACQIVREAMNATAFARVALSVLRNPIEHCSLKCAALAQLAGELDDTTEVVVFADADLVSHDAWLRELIDPLLDDPGIGATYGNRWFWPQNAWWGSLVRYVWNVAAVVPMTLCKIPWGGTFAIRAESLRSAGLLEKWANAIVEDAPIRSALDSIGLKLHFVPGLMMINREDCRLPFSLDFIKRQLTWTRLYHPNWWIVAAHALLTTSALLAALLFVPCGLLSGNGPAAGWGVAGIMAYLSVMTGLIALLEGTVREVAEKRGDEIETFSARKWFRIILAIPLAQAVHIVAVILAIFRRTISWRGVSYQIRGPWDVRMIDYRPYQGDARPSESTVSL